MKKTVIVILSVILKIHISDAQEIVPFRHLEIEYKKYIGLVSTNNLGFAAERLNLDISEAAIQAAKIFQDPYISVDYSHDLLAGSKTGYGLSSELVKTVDLGGERKARVDLSGSEKELTRSLLADYFRNLQADATLTYLEGMKQQQLYIVRYDSYKTMKKLYEADSIRLSLGSIMQIDAIQSKLEAGILLNDVTHSLAEWKNSLFHISLMTGRTLTDSLMLPSSHMHDVSREFLLDSLLMAAINNRADLQAALYNKDVSQKALRLTRKERNTDIDLKIGYANYFIADGTSPKSTGLTAGIGIPLKFSNFNKSEIAIAEFRTRQADELYKQAELQVIHDVLQAWELYQDYSRQVQNFNEALLEDAENVRKGKIYSYQRGETSLLEVLNAQRTYNEIQTTYYETRFNQTAALIELERAAGIWDISF